MEKIKLICSTCKQVINKNEIHDCTISISKRNEYVIDKKVEFSFLSFIKLK